MALCCKERNSFDNSIYTLDHKYGIYFFKILNQELWHYLRKDNFLLHTCTLTNKFVQTIYDTYIFSKGLEIS
jgi:hypothetical protein